MRERNWGWRVKVFMTEWLMEVTLLCSFDAFRVGYDWGLILEGKIAVAYSSYTP